MQEGEEGRVGSGSGSGSAVIAQHLQQEVEEGQKLIRFMNELQRHCIYCQLIYGDNDERLHLY